MRIDWSCGAVGLTAAALLAFRSWLQGQASARSSEDDGRRRVALVVTGSVAAVKAPALAAALIRSGLYVDLVLTTAGEFFQGVLYKGCRPAEQLAALAGRRDAQGSAWLTVWRDQDEWSAYGAVGDPVLHVNLAKRNQALVFAPLDANTLRKLVVGESSNLASCVARAWYWRMDPQFAAAIDRRVGDYAMRRPVVVAPAMNTYMWHQQITQQQLAELEGMGATVVLPVVKTLACGDTGAGAMASVEEIAKTVVESLEQWEAARDRCLGSGMPTFVA